MHMVELLRCGGCNIELTTIQVVHGPWRSSDTSRGKIFTLCGIYAAKNEIE